ncbi:MAG: N-acetyltransferase [Chloroflexaceae bacterium]|nr:N-acetyltransferase [Chloroflexaceae bacterium]
MALVIRTATPDDTGGILAIYRPFIEHSHSSFETEVPTLDAMGTRISSGMERFPWLVAAADDMVAGYVYAGSHRSRTAYQWSVEVSVYIHPDYYRRNLGRALYTALFAVLAAQGYFNAYAGITPPNPGSLALHTSMGFQYIGIYEKVGYKQGAWHDVTWWVRVLHPHRTDPPSPLLFPTLPTEW